MQRFPLLKLPSLALEPILKSLDIKNLIDLSMMSSRFKRTLQCFKFSINYFDVYIDDSRAGVVIGYEEKHENGRSLQKYMAIESRRPYYTDVWKIRRLNGEKIMLCDSENDSLRILMAKNDTIGAKVERLEQICTHLLSFMKVKHLQFDCRVQWRQWMNSSNVFIWNITCWDRVEFYPLILQRIQVTPEDLFFLLEKVRTLSSFLKATRRPDVKCTKSFNFSTIPVGNSCWVDFMSPEIHKTIQIEFRINGVEVAESDVNRLIKEWEDKKDSSLKNLKLLWNKRSRNQNIKMHKILEGLEALPKYMRHPFLSF